MVSSSLFEDLTNSASQPFAATSLIKNLIELVATDVCSFRRNTQVSYRFVDHCRSLYDKINCLIAEVEKDPKWEDYEKYVEAIEPLEAALLSFVPDADSEHDQYLHDSKTVEACVKFVTNWETNRKQIRDNFNAIKTQSKLSVLIEGTTDDASDLEAACNHDDRVFVEDLVAAMKVYATTRTKAFSKKITARFSEIHHGAENILINFTSVTQPTVESELKVVAIKCVMIVYGVMELALNETISKDLSLSFQSDKVWLPAKELLVQADDHLKTQKPSSDLKKLYDAFIDLITQTAGVHLPASYPNLFKNVGKIGRSYHAQALLLVQLCRAAANHFEKPEHKTGKNYAALENAFDQTVVALEGAVKSVESAVGEAGLPSVAKYDIEKYENSDCATLFKQSIDELSTCFKAIGLPDAESIPSKLDEAKIKDKERMTAVNNKISKVYGDSPTGESKLVEVTITVRQKDGKTLGNMTVNVPPTTRISAIGWKVSKHSEYKDKIKGTESKFEQEVAETPATMKEVTLDTSVKDLEKDSKCSLFMVV